MDKENKTVTAESKDNTYGDTFGSVDLSGDKNNKKRQITVNLSTLILVAGLCVAVALMAVFAVLYFSSLNNKPPVETVVVTQAVTQPVTEPETQPVTQAETKAKKKTKKTTTQESFDSYKLTLYPSTHIYSGPGYEYEYVMSIDEQGVYTIVDECYSAKSRSTWGKLKSGVGWINLNETRETPAPPKPQQPQQPAYVEVETQGFSSYTLTVYASTDVYSGPGYSYSYVMTIEEQGVYTIVEEANASDGTTWGKLKSGVGWILLQE